MWHSWGQHMGMVPGTGRWVRRAWDTMCGLGSRQDGRNRGTGSGHPTPPSAAALPQTGQAAQSPPPQHGKAAPRVGVKGCRAFIHHTTSRHDTGVQDGVGREPVIGAGGALHATLAWAGERKQEDRAGANGFTQNTSGFTPGWALACGQGQNPWRGWSRISQLHTSSKYSPQIPCRLHLSPPVKCPAPLLTE